MQLSKKDKTIQREQSILLCARKTIAKHGLIGLKMPELAKDAAISIGTLYRHFESREDLIAAMAEYSLRARCAKLELTLTLFSTPLQRIIAAPMLDFLFNVNHREAFHAETNCSNSTLWQFASNARRQNFLNQSKRVSSLIKQVIADVASQYDDRDAATGLWSLVTGMSFIWYSHEHESNLEEALIFFRPHLISYFCGYLPQLNIINEDIVAIEKYLLENSDSWIWQMNGETHEND